MQHVDIDYIFKFTGKQEKHVHVCLDPQTLDLIVEIPENLPTWTNLDFHQCPNCLLSIQTSPKCSVAIHLVRLIEYFEYLQSYDIILVEIMTPERITFNETSAQKGLSSLLGLIMSTCGCPHTDFFKPMARFHLPFANALETTFRAVSMYLVAQYLRRKQGLNADLELEGLKKRLIRNKVEKNLLRSLLIFNFKWLRALKLVKPHGLRIWERLTAQDSFRMDKYWARKSAKPLLISFCKSLLTISLIKQGNI